VKIPLSRDDAAPRTSDSQIRRTLDFSQVVALVVEDDADARELTKRILLDVGATVVEASSAEEALSVVDAAKPNILISDIGMARQDGYQLVRRLRAAGHSADTLPAIALTAFARNEDRSEALAAGFQDHLIKPLEPQTLLARIGFLRMSAKANTA
jgi:CheY-like chemotaxis protein